MAALLVNACGEGVMSPSPAAFPFLSIRCVPAGSDVSCAATMYDYPGKFDQTDVTRAAMWTSSDPAVGAVVGPGQVEARSIGPISIGARFMNWSSEASVEFLLAPGLPSRRLYFLICRVVDATSGVELAGVRVDILDGYAAGATATSNSWGHVRFDRILTEETFTLEASRAGYAITRLSYTVAPPEGVGGTGSGPFLLLKLARVDQTPSNSTLFGDDECQTIWCYSALNGHRFGVIPVLAEEKRLEQEFEGICYGAVQVPGGAAAQIHAVLLENPWGEAALDDIFFKSFWTTTPDEV